RAVGGDLAGPLALHLVERDVGDEGAIRASTMAGGAAGSRQSPRPSQGTAPGGSVTGGGMPVREAAPTPARPSGVERRGPGRRPHQSTYSNRWNWLRSVPS